MGGMLLWVTGRQGWQEYWWGKWVGWGRMRHNTGKRCQAQALKCILSTVELFLHGLEQITPFLSQSLCAKSPSHRAIHQNTDQESSAALRFIWFYKRWWFQSSWEVNLLWLSRPLLVVAPLSRLSKPGGHTSKQHSYSASVPASRLPASVSGLCDMPGWCTNKL